MDSGDAWCSAGTFDQLLRLAQSYYQGSLPVWLNAEQAGLNEQIASHLLSLTRCSLLPVLFRASKSQPSVKTRAYLAFAGVDPTASDLCRALSGIDDFIVRGAFLQSLRPLFDGSAWTDSKIATRLALHRGEWKITQYARFEAPLMRMLCSSHPALISEGGWMIVVVGRQAQEDALFISAIERVARGIQQVGIQDETDTLTELRGLPETNGGPRKFEIGGISGSQAQRDNADRTQRLGNLHVLPDEILLLVLSFLHPFALLNLHSVNSTYQDLVRAEIDWSKFWDSDTKSIETKSTGLAAITQFATAFKESPGKTLTMLCASSIFDADETAELDGVRSMGVVGTPITYRGPIKFPQVLKIMTRFRLNQLLADEQQLNHVIEHDIFNWSKSIVEHPQFRHEADNFIQRLLDQALCLAEEGESIDSSMSESHLDETPNLDSAWSKVRAAKSMSGLVRDRRLLSEYCRLLTPLLLRHVRFPNSWRAQLQYASVIKVLDRMIRRDHVMDNPEEAQLSSEVADLLFRSAMDYLDAFKVTSARTAVEVSMLFARRAGVQFERRPYERLIQKIDEMEANA